MGNRHRAWATVDLEAFRHNLRLIRRFAGQAEVWPVLKANAYGHGARAIARVCESENVALLGVGDSTEALELRDAGINTPLLVLGTAVDAEIPALLEHDIEVGVHSEVRALQLSAAARAAGHRLGVHLKIDTGMTRLGVLPEAALRVAQTVSSEPWLELRGVMTHFACPGGYDEVATAEQEHRFAKTLDQLRAHGLPVAKVHCSNSAALFTGKQVFGDAVRPGIALYGVMPLALQQDFGLRPVLSLQTQVVFLKDIPAATAVGYGGKWRAPSPTRLAVMPLGYNDGIPYRLGAEGHGKVLLRGQFCPIVGAISMDYCTVDVGHVPNVDIGDTVTLIGRDGDHSLSVQDLSAAAGTIPYEIVCSIGSRVHRVYHHDSATAADEPVEISG